MYEQIERDYSDELFAVEARTRLTAIRRQEHPCRRKR
jgi:hypothetical protein